MKMKTCTKQAPKLLISEFEFKSIYYVTINLVILLFIFGGAELMVIIATLQESNLHVSLIIYQHVNQYYFKFLKLFLIDFVL